MVFRVHSYVRQRGAVPHQKATRNGTIASGNGGVLSLSRENVRVN